MSSDSAAALISRVEQISRDADNFRKCVELFCHHGNVRWHCEFEKTYGARAKRLADDLRWMKTVEDRFPPQTRFGFDSLHDLFFTLVQRWQWDRVVDADGDSYLCAQAKLMEERKHPYLSAGRSYVEACRTKQVNERPEQWHFDLAEEAQRMGIPTSTPFEGSKETIEALYKSWLFSPYLGPDFPKLTVDEGTTWKTATLDIEEGIRGMRLDGEEIDQPTEPITQTEVAPLEERKTPETVGAPERDRHDNGGTPSGEPDRVPSVNELTELLQAIQLLANHNRYTSRCTWVQEDESLRVFCRCANALRPLRPLVNSIDRWPPVVEQAISAIASTFDAIASDWGWERVAEPNPSAYLEERRAWFLNSVTRPMYEAALSWQARDGVRCPLDVSKVAIEGWSSGFKPVAPNDQVETVYREAHSRWVETPRFGTCYPNLKDEQEKSLLAPMIQLRAVLAVIPQRSLNVPESQPLKIPEQIEQNNIEAPEASKTAVNARNEPMRTLEDQWQAILANAPSKVDLDAMMKASFRDMDRIQAMFEAPERKAPGSKAGDLTVATNETKSGAIAPPSPAERQKEPSKRAIDAYRAVKFAGKKQEEIAPLFGVRQGTVSRWIKQVSEWIATGNILPSLDAPKRKATPMDPRKLEQGPRRPRAHKPNNMRDETA
jgi:hypothetical protein